MPLTKVQLMSAPGGPGGIGGVKAGAGVSISSEGVITASASSWKNTVSVTDYGAVGNGTTDDRAAIQAAIDYILSLPYGGEVVFPAGNYLISGTLFVDRQEPSSGPGNRLGITLTGVNDGGSTITRGSGMTGPSIYVGGTSSTGTNKVRSYATIANLSFESVTPSITYTDAYIHLCAAQFIELYTLYFGDGGCCIWMQGVIQSNVSFCSCVWRNAVGGNTDKHMVILDKTPATYGYQQLCGDVTFTSCNFRMAAPVGQVIPPAKSSMWIRCCDGIFVTNTHLQGADYVVWIDNTETGLVGATSRGLYGIRMTNCWLDLMEGGQAVGTASVYISGNAKEAGDWNFGDTVFNGGTNYLYGIFAENAVNCQYGFQVDNCHFAGFRNDAVNMNIAAASSFSYFQLTNSDFFQIQTSNGDTFKPVIQYQNIGLSRVANNTPTTANANQFLVINGGAGPAQVVDNFLSLPNIYQGNYSNAISGAAGTQIYQFNNPPMLSPGPFGSDAAAASGGVPVGGFYRNATGGIQQRAS